SKTEDGKFNQFDKGEKLGCGGYGIVYKATDRHNGKYYAIKSCDLTNLGDKEKFYVLQETVHLIKVASDYVVEYNYSWFQQNCLYFQMELCWGSLSDFLETKMNVFGRLQGQLMTDIELYISYEIFRELIECLEYLHQEQIIHRDLKPANVLITKTGISYTKNGTKNRRFVKICDFGLSKGFYEYRLAGDKQTPDKGTVGPYMAPEAIQDDYNHKIDIYSLAMIGADIFEIDKDNLQNFR
ncbi:unnamed protein product, partial [Oppiella nova]